MAKFAVKPVKVLIPKLKQEQVKVIEIPDFLVGLFTDLDPEQIPENACTQLDNFDFYRGMPFRRNGLQPWPVPAPNTDPVLNVFPFFERSTGLNILRFTKSAIYSAAPTSWIPITPSGMSANSGDNNHFFTAGVIDNRFFFANGVDPIREVTIASDHYVALGDAPVYKYITTAFDRVIGASFVGSPNVGYQIGWSGIKNYGEWNPLTDITAGSQQLTSSPSSLSDDITGLFFTSQILLVPRQQSIFIGLVTSSGTSPFQFFQGIPLNVGADLPRTITLSDYGLLWVSNATSGVYAWVPGSTVTKVSDIEITGRIKRALRIALNNASQIWASYTHETRIYRIFISYGTQSIVQVFAYNFLYGNWTTNEIDGSLYSVSEVAYGNSNLSINSLPGTINALLGTIDSLGGVQQNATTAYGFKNGNLATHNPFSGLPDEFSNIEITDNGLPFQSTLATKIIEEEINDIYQNIVRLDLTPYNAGGTVTLSYSKDDGKTWVAAKSVTFNTTYQEQTILVKRALRFRRIVWKATTSDCMCAVNGFYAYALKGGISSS